MGRLEKEPTEIDYLKREKTIIKLEVGELPKYLEKEELVLFLDTIAKNG